eukprot:1161342-Pelagomonas_calceolata.AAC.3
MPICAAGQRPSITAASAAACAGGRMKPGCGAGHTTDGPSMSPDPPLPTAFSMGPGAPPAVVNPGPAAPPVVNPGAGLPGLTHPAVAGTGGAVGAAAAEPFGVDPDSVLRGLPHPGADGAVGVLEQLEGTGGAGGLST